MGSGRYAPPSTPPSSISPPSSPSSSDSAFSLKRKRRTADEIKRHFQCSSPRCTKSYGSESALKMHFKLKHEKRTSPTSVLSTSPISTQPNKAQRTSGTPTSKRASLSISPSASPSLSPSSSVSPSPSSASASPSASPPTSTKANNSGLSFVPSNAFSFAPQLASVLSALAIPQNLPSSSAASLGSSLSSSLTSSLNLPLLKLRMGLWERQSICFGDLIARISTSERCFFWESVNLDGIVRTGVQFDSITSLQVDENCIHITASQPPSFSLGRVQPGATEKNGNGLSTSWKSMPEFLLLIGGNCLTHTLTVARGSLSFSSLLELIVNDHHLKRVFLPTGTSSAPSSSPAGSLSIPTAVLPTMISNAHPISSPSPPSTPFLSSSSSTFVR